jgi:hypothetical protein
MAGVCVCCRCKKNPKHSALGVPKSNFPIKQLGPNRLSGVGGWGLGGPPRLSAYVANSLSTRKLLAAQRSFSGAIGELEPPFFREPFFRERSRHRPTAPSPSRDVRYS